MVCSESACNVKYNLSEPCVPVLRCPVMQRVTAILQIARAKVRVGYNRCICTGKRESKRLFVRRSSRASQTQIPDLFRRSIDSGTILFSHQPKFVFEEPDSRRCCNCPDRPLAVHRSRPKLDLPRCQLMHEAADGDALVLSA